MVLRIRPYRALTFVGIFNDGQQGKINKTILWSQFLRQFFFLNGATRIFLPRFARGSFSLLCTDFQSKNAFLAQLNPIFSAFASLGQKKFKKSQKFWPEINRCFSGHHFYGCTFRGQQKAARGMPTNRNLVGKGLSPCPAFGEEPEASPAGIVPKR